MKKIIFITFIAFFISLAATQDAFAHATPIEYDPTPAIVLERLPEKVVIRFTERVEPGASSILIYGPDGALLSSDKARVRPEDAHYYEVDMPPGTEGTYAVSWQVVSADDGHFTKGAFTFSLGKQGGVNLVSAREQLQIVHSSPIEEILAVWIELVGQAIFAGIIVFLLFIFRPLKRRLAALRQPEFDAALKRRLRQLTILAAVLAIAGTTSYILAKTISLQNVQVINFKAALASFMTTVAGKTALYRMLVGVGFLAIFIAGIKSIFRSDKVTIWEYVLTGILIGASILRILSSHAMAAIVLPLFSQFDHVLHNLAKNIWAGSLILLVVVAWVLKRMEMREHMRFLLLSWSRVLAIAIGLALLTGVYVIWLDLKDFSNILLTDWGKRLLFFSLLVGPLVLLRFYHIFFVERKLASLAQSENLRHFRIFNFTFALELFFGMSILYGTAASMVTTPPIPAPNLFEARSESRDTAITLQEHPYEKNEFLISFSNVKNDRPTPVTSITVTLFNEEKNIGPIVADAQRRSNASFAFSKSALSPTGRWRIDISGSQEGAYDAVGSVTLSYPNDIEALDRGSANLPIPVFSYAMMIVALINLAFSLFLFFITLRRGRMMAAENNRESVFLFSNAKSALIAALVFVLYLGLAFSAESVAFRSSFEKLCRKNGDMWHVMTPTRNGRIVSQNSFAGCMTADGQYHFADDDEYAYFARPLKPNASLSMSPQNPIAGQPMSFIFDIRGEGGHPIDLTISHERLLHVVVIGEDFSVFSHIHAEDAGPIGKEARDNAHFTVPYTLPKAGNYLMSIDYQAGKNHYSQQFKIGAQGVPQMEKRKPDFRATQQIEDHRVDLKIEPSAVLAKKPVTLTYHFSEGGEPVKTLEAYLGAAMHLAIVKNDLSNFIHTHGEVHAPGAQPAPPGVHIHNAYLPHFFGPDVEAHLSFPEAGIYHIFGEFKHEGKVWPTHFTIRVN